MLDIPVYYATMRHRPRIMKQSITILCILLTSCSCVSQQQQQIKAGYNTCANEVKEVRQSIDDFKASVLKSVAAKLHISTGDEKAEDSTVHLSDEELGTLKTIVQAIKNAPPVTRSSWRIGSNFTSVLRAGYSTFKSIHFLDHEGRELASLALNHDTEDEGAAHTTKHDAHSSSLPAAKQKELDSLPTVSSYSK